ncbi:nucleotidyltransferase family protein [Synechococcus sp. PCC 7336]|uniref:nucleotidyltransferase family protein n=1 Tax=Synechococcus sp. PCC 7336 TaxID=195250 RepID=UPI00034B75E5|nr:nucleotidyltransferase family protein [Synechococcus sp. PCC 7336]
MDKHRAIDILRANEANIRKLGVTSLYLFGSTVRGEARSDSDVDLFFDYNPAMPFTLFDLFDIQEFFTSLLAGHVDIMTRDSIHPLIRDRVIDSAERIF